MREICRGEIMNDYDTLLLGLWKICHFSPKQSSLLESFHVSFLKAAVTSWVTHDRASEHVLDCFL